MDVFVWTSTTSQPPGTPLWNGVGLVCVTSTTFNSSWRVMDKPTFHAFKIQVTITSSLGFISTPCKLVFLILVLPLRWCNSKIIGMFQNLLTFFKEVCPCTITSMASSSCWSIHLLHQDALSNILFFLELFVVIMAQWRCCCDGIVVDCICPISCVAKMGF